MPRKKKKMLWNAKTPVVIMADDLDAAARQFLTYAQSAKAAHNSITRCAKAAKKQSGRPAHDDTVLLLIAAALQDRRKCSKNDALALAVQLTTRDAKATAVILRRLKAKVIHRVFANSPTRSRTGSNRRTAQRAWFFQ